MKQYQALALIGCIIGILLLFGLRIFYSMMGANILSPYASSDFGGSLLLYIIGIVITFALRKTKAAGTILIIIAVFIFFLGGSFLFVIPFVLLLIAGIKAIRWKGY